MLSEISLDEIRAVCVCVLAGGRYDQQPQGLHISNVTRADEGDYFCQAVVESSGMFKEQTITLKMLG